MIQNTISSEELRHALVDARPIFLNRKITIDDVSRDIKALEIELANYQVAGDFSFDFGMVASLDHGSYIEDYDFHAPVVRRRLAWKLHGGRWRLFYQAYFAGYKNFSISAMDDCSAREREKLSEAIDHLGDEMHAGFLLDSKPLIDTNTEIRIESHSRLPDFVRAFAQNWTSDRYARDQGPAVSLVPSL